MNNNKFKYTVTNSVSNQWIVLLGFLIFAGIAAWMYVKSIMLFFFPALLAAVLLFSTIYGVYNKLYKKILIDEKGFYYQTSPSNSKYFAFADISKAWMNKTTPGSGAIDYLFFQTANGNIYKFNLSAVNDGDGVYYMLKEINGEDWTDDAYDDE